MTKTIVPIVWDNQGNPVAAAMVFMQSAADECLYGMTAEDGSCSLQPADSLDDTQLTIVHDNFKAYSVHINLRTGNKQIRVGMPPDPNRPEDIILAPLVGYVLPIMEPTREQVCNIYCGFQGISILTKQFGWIPAFGPECGALNDEDTISYCKQMRDFGFTHVEFDISWQYVERDYAYPVPGKDLSQDLNEVCRRCNLIVEQGMIIKFALAGDGLSIDSSPYGYNDPQGWTYGYEWLMENLGRILFSLRTYAKRDLTKWIIFVPGYDAIFYGWGREGEVPDRQPERVISFGQLFRSILPNGYLGIEHTPGNIPVGEGSANWKTGGVLDPYDTLLGEFQYDNYHVDSTWQILGRMCRPYIRPSDQPAGDDPNPEYYLADCTRGKRFYIIYEIKTYSWVRGCPYQEVLDAMRYFHSMAPETTICGLLN